MATAPTVISLRPVLIRFISYLFHCQGMMCLFLIGLIFDRSQEPSDYPTLSKFTDVMAVFVSHATYLY